MNSLTVSERGISPDDSQAVASVVSDPSRWIVGSDQRVWFLVQDDWSSHHPCENLPSYLRKEEVLPYRLLVTTVRQAHPINTTDLITQCAPAEEFRAGGELIARSLILDHLSDLHRAGFLLVCPVVVIPGGSADVADRHGLVVEVLKVRNALTSPQDHLGMALGQRFGFDNVDNAWKIGRPFVYNSNDSNDPPPRDGHLQLLNLWERLVAGGISGLVPPRKPAGEF